MENRSATNLATLRRRREAVLRLIRALEEYRQATRAGVPLRPIRISRPKRSR